MPCRRLARSFETRKLVRNQGFRHGGGRGSVHSVIDVMASFNLDQHKAPRQGSIVCLACWFAGFPRKMLRTAPHKKRARSTRTRIIAHLSSGARFPRGFGCLRWCSHCPHGVVSVGASNTLKKDTMDKTSRSIRQRNTASEVSRLPEVRVQWHIHQRFKSRYCRKASSPSSCLSCL